MDNEWIIDDTTIQHKIVNQLKKQLQESREWRPKLAFMGLNKLDENGEVEAQFFEEEII